MASVGFADRTGRRCKPERPVIGLAVLVAGETEPQRHQQDDDGGRDDPPRPDDPHAGHVHAVGRSGAGVQAGGGQARRVERQNVGTPVVVGVRELGPGGVSDKAAEPRRGGYQRCPPSVVRKLRCAMAARPPSYRTAGAVIPGVRPWCSSSYAGLHPETICHHRRLPKLINRVPASVLAGCSAKKFWVIGNFCVRAALAWCCEPTSEERYGPSRTSDRGDHLERRGALHPAAVGSASQLLAGTGSSMSDRAGLRGRSDPCPDRGGSWLQPGDGGQVASTLRR